MCLNSYNEAQINIQKELLRIWESTLEIGNININDDFFDLGGSSYQVFQILIQIKNELGFDVSLNCFLDCLNIANLTNAIRTNQFNY
jgi:acyl carrier protein